MPQIINTNISSLNAQRNLDQSQNAQDTALARLSSGLRVNSSKDDAAGLQIANRLDSQIRGLNVASRNAGDGVSLAQIAEGSIESISTSLQRLRELAVQSSNATNGDSERAALNEEATQLVAEIERTSGSATFNGVNLLDGSFQNKSFQVGANVGDDINVSLGAVDTSTLGSAATSGVSGNVSKAGIVTNAANLDLAGGDLVINGITVGASAAGDDIASTGLKASSGIAKAAAINAVSDQTGVSAVAAPNSIEGTSTGNITATGGAQTIVINGVGIDLDVAATTTADGTRNELQKVAESIKEKADASGVTASVVQSNAAGTEFRVDLTAADGRNITINEGTDDSTVFGLGEGGDTAAALTYVGNVTLVSEDGSDINLGTTTGDIDNAGFEIGSFAGSTAAVVGDNSVDTARAAITAGDLIINGTQIGATSASDDIASTASESASGIALAAAINRASDTTGVTATANQNTAVSAAIDGADLTDLVINGVNIADSTGTTIGEKLTNLVANVNAASGQTGVRAEALGADQYVLTADDGRNIVAAGTAATSGLAGGGDTFIAGVTLTSGGAIELGSDTGNIERAGLNVGSFGGAESGTLLKDVDISTAGGAKAAISAVDNAISTVNAERAKLGSIQTRFENVISANQIAVENFSASKSRIVDADFAAETAALSRSQVLQQAGISVLAQANARPQQVLSLLQ
jgi:flagellin